MKRKRDARIYLEDILSAIQRIEEYTMQGKDLFRADGKTQDAVIRQLAVIGEAAAKLSAPIKTKHAEISWKKIIGMRNIIIHDYSETDIPTIWGTVEHDLPDLKQKVAMMLEEESA